ncbi:MAG: 50S ribosomal protein L29 [Firmicutes bacterium]|jgi:large subunit ribosomal protein L29|nr:50S ribosomal protein L29 [Bacillota bacterium]
MKASELRELTLEELQKKADDLKAELFNLRFQLATGQLDNYRRIRMVRKDLARVKTVLWEREAQIETNRKQEGRRLKTRNA